MIINKQTAERGKVNPNWLESFAEYPDWQDHHDMLLGQAILESDAAKHWHNTVLALLDRARFAAIEECIIIVQQGDSPLKHMRALLEEIKTGEKQSTLATDTPTRATE